MFSLKSLFSNAKSPSVPAAGNGDEGAIPGSKKAPKGVKASSTFQPEPHMTALSDDEKSDKIQASSPFQPEPHMTALSDDILRLLLKCLPPKETSSLLQSCKSLAKLSADSWRSKLYAMKDEYVIPYEERAAIASSSTERRRGGETNSGITNSALDPTTPTKHYRLELQKRYRRVNRYRPNIERWGEEPYWFANHPCETSPFNAVRRAHDVTDFRISVQTNRLERGRYRAYWRVNSTSGFCVLQMDTEVHSEVLGDGSMGGHMHQFSSLWNAREDRGKGWTDVCATGGKVIEIGPNGGYIKARMWKRELDFTGGILVDCLEIQKLEPVLPLMNSSLLMSSW